MNSKLWNLALVAALLTPPAFSDELPAPAEDCPPEMTKMAKDFTSQVAADVEKRRRAAEARVQQLTERVLQEIRNNSDTADGIEGALEKLRTEFAIRPEDSQSELLKESVGKLREYGTSTQSVIDSALELGRKVGAVKVMGGKDGFLTKIGKKLPLVNRWVVSAQERNQSGQDAISNLGTVVDNQVGETRRVDGLMKQDEMNWREEYQHLWEQADMLAGVRDAVQATVNNQDGLTELQKRAYEAFIDELETAELIYRDLAESLQQQVLMNITVQKGLKETRKLLQTSTKAQLRKLAALMSNIAGQDTATKGQKLASDINDSVLAAETAISKDLKESTEKMTKLLQSIGDRSKSEKAREDRRQASLTWKKHDEEIRSIREARITELKQAYASGTKEVQDHEVQTNTQAAVMPDVQIEKEATPETEARPQARPQ